MARNPFAHIIEDNSGIREWLEWKRGIKPSREAPDARSPSPAPDVAPTLPETIQAPAPVTADGACDDERYCQGCGKKLPTGIGTRARSHCGNACRLTAFKKRHGLPNYTGPGAKTEATTLEVKE